MAEDIEYPWVLTIETNNGASSVLFEFVYARRTQAEAEFNALAKARERATAVAGETVLVEDHLGMGLIVGSSIGTIRLVNEAYRLARHQNIQAYAMANAAALGSVINVGGYDA